MARKNIPSVDSYLKKFLIFTVVLSLPLFLFAMMKNTGGGQNFAARPEIYGNIALADSEAQLSYGDSISFLTNSTGKMNPKGYLYIRIVCVQEKNVVYQWSSRDLNFAFPLTDQAGQGLEWDGNSASCQADLVYRVDGSRNVIIQPLDTVLFDVAGI